MNDKLLLSNLFDVSNGLLDGKFLFFLSGFVDSSNNFITSFSLLGFLDGLHILLDRLLGLSFFGSNGNLEGSSSGFLNGKFSLFIKFVLVNLLKGLD